MPGPFNLDHLHPFEPLLFQNFPTGAGKKAGICFSRKTCVPHLNMSFEVAIIFKKLTVVDRKELEMEMKASHRLNSTYQNWIKVTLF